MTQALPYFFSAATLAALAFVLIQLSTIGRHLMATQADVDKLVTQVVKVRGEIQNIKAELALVKEQLATAESTEEIDLSALEAAIQAADDENADPAHRPALLRTARGRQAPQPVEDAPAE